MTSAIITGAGRGIGRATAHLFAERGVDVALFGPHAESLEQVAREVSSRGAKAISIVGDVSVRADVEAAEKRTRAELGAANFVVNNAGVVHRGRLEATDEAAWDRVVDVNLKGTFLVSRAFLPSMVARGSGRIVSVGSISSTLGTSGLTAYCAAKWGVVGFTKALAEELRGTGVQTICVLPGSVDTDMLKGSGFEPAMTAEEVARALVFAAMDAPAAMNGSAVEMFGP